MASPFSLAPTWVDEDNPQVAAQAAREAAARRMQNQVKTPFGSLAPRPLPEAIQNIGSDYRAGVTNQQAGAAAMGNEAVDNMKSGNIGRMLLGLGQGTLSPILGASAPLGGAMNAITKGAGRVGPGMEHAAEVATLLNPDTSLLATAPILGKLGGGAGFLKNVRPPRESIPDVLNSNFLHGRHVGNRMVPLDKIETTMSSSADDAARVKSLAEKMKGPEGYWERPIIDDAGNVVEGQHRINALRSTGYQGDVPVTLVRDAARGLPTDKMAEAIRGVGTTHPDHVNQIIGQIADMVAESGSPAAVLREYEFPPQFRTRFEAALNAAQPSLKAADK